LMASLEIPLKVLERRWKQSKHSRITATASAVVCITIGILSLFKLPLEAILILSYGICMLVFAWKWNNPKKPVPSWVFWILVGYGVFSMSWYILRIIQLLPLIIPVSGIEKFEVNISRWIL